MALDASTLSTLVTQPQSVTVDGCTVQARSLRDVLEADRYSRSLMGHASKRTGLRLFLVRDPGRPGESWQS